MSRLLQRTPLLRASRQALRPTSARFFSTPANIEGYGKNVFKGTVADEYLSAEGLPSGTLNSSAWTQDPAAADKVADAVLKWATDNGATFFCHWFQPFASSGVRHGLSGQVQNAFFKFDGEGKPVWDLKGKDLIQGETDGSSYPNGGLRATHTAGGYLKVDPTSHIWLRGDTIFIPACFVSYYGHALDEKTPLLRSVDAMNREGTRLLSLMGWDVPGLQSNIGLEQEIFLIPREEFIRRPDLQLTGRTVIGKDAPRGQEMCDHYMAPPSTTSPALDCMAEIQRQCFEVGIPLRTRHREVAPNQYEFAPLFGSVTTQIDQNIIVMQIIEEVAPQYGLAALLQEKPFNNVNGSGKHNNWSVATTDGCNLLNVNQVTEVSGIPHMFATIMSAIVSGVDMHGDLMRMAIASPGNDFRLGACEAPPAIVSTYLGEDMTAYLDDFRNGKVHPYQPTLKELDLGVSCIAPLTVPAEDRNRTSPFPYGGHRFEFRAVGSSQNVSMVNTVLNTITADGFKRFADKIEAGASPQDVAAEALNDHWKVIFNGDNYDEANQAMLTERGVWRIDSGIDAICSLSADKNIELFSDMNVLSEPECKARQTCLVDHYVGTVEMEALCLVDMLNQHVIPAVKAAEGKQLRDLQAAVGTIKHALAAVHAEEDEQKKGNLARTLRLETMVAIRDVVDEAEGETPANLWTLPTYKDLLFLDHNYLAYE
mmetsp:Transcript_30682/g.42876  ORF Transcript_30682/g.42876 Transcript_30682/m.42876 type:complete len:708 (+) Transcript_30682:3-2126(+)|eukprot:jgi/Bigna1/92312/estExt_fgenesh1_pm.C_140006